MPCLGSSRQMCTFTIRRTLFITNPPGKLYNFLWCLTSIFWLYLSSKVKKKPCCPYLTEEEIEALTGDVTCRRSKPAAKRNHIFDPLKSCAQDEESCPWFSPGMASMLASCVKWPPGALYGRYLWARWVKEEVAVKEEGALQQMRFQHPLLGSFQTMVRNSSGYSSLAGPSETGSGCWNLHRVRQRVTPCDPQHHSAGHSGLLFRELAQVTLGQSSWKVSSFHCLLFLISSSFLNPLPPGSCLSYSNKNNSDSLLAQTTELSSFSLPTYLPAVFDASHPPSFLSPSPSLGSVLLPASISPPTPMSLCSFSALESPPSTHSASSNTSLPKISLPPPSLTSSRLLLPSLPHLHWPLSSPALRFQLFLL